MLFLIPSLSLGLTFKDGKQVEDEPEILIIEGNKNYTKLSKDDYLKLSFEEKTNYLDIGLSGYYIDESLKNKFGNYVLPSRAWMKKYVNHNDGIFYREGASFW